MTKVAVMKVNESVKDKPKGSLLRKVCNFFVMKYCSECGHKLNKDELYKWKEYDRFDCSNCKTTIYNIFKYGE